MFSHEYVNYIEKWILVLPMYQAENVILTASSVYSAFDDVLDFFWWEPTIVGEVFSTDYTYVVCSSKGLGMVQKINMNAQAVKGNGKEFPHFYDPMYVPRWLQLFVGIPHCDQPPWIFGSSGIWATMLLRIWIFCSMEAEFLRMFWRFSYLLHDHQRKSVM
jgi:hypothetical protein